MNAKRLAREAAIVGGQTLLCLLGIVVIATLFLVASAIRMIGD